MEQKKDRGLFFWIGIFAFYFFFAAVLVPEDHVQKLIVAEKKELAEYLGNKSAISIVRNAEGTFQSWFEETGLVEALYAAFIPTQNEQRRSLGLERLGEREGWFAVAREKIDVFWVMVYFALQRFYAMVVWIPITGIFIGAAIWDGWMMRRIKLVGFEPTSAPIYGIARHVFMLGLLLPIFYAFAPIPVTPLFAPIWGTLMAFLLMMKAANLQRF